MILLVNPTNNPLKVEYTYNSKVYVSELRPFLIVGMKNLAVVEQITNRAALAKQGVTVYNYELGTYYNRGNIGGFTFGSAGAPYAFQFIPHNSKREAYTNYNSATMSGGSLTMQGLVA